MYTKPMLTIDEPFETADILTLSRHIRGERPLFIDIETTGLSPERSIIYLIGCAWQTGPSPSSCLLRQLFAETPSEERSILLAFLSCVEGFDTLIHFNGDRFDLRFLRARLAACGLDSHPLYASFVCKESFDFYHVIRSHRDALGLPDCRQKSLEHLLQTDRMDDTNGGELIRVYQAQVQHPDSELRAMLLLHNADDVKGLTALARVFGFLDFLAGFREIVQVSGIREEAYHGLGTGNGREVYLSFTCDTQLPAPLSLHRGDFFLKVRDGAGCLRVPLFAGELKHFYPDPKNYYYLPAEDEAIHKSVSQFVDKARRVPARRETCYTRRTGSFLPLCLPSAKTGKSRDTGGKEHFLSEAGIPVFQKAYGDGQRYIEYKKEQDMQPYLLHVLSLLFSE